MNPHASQPSLPVDHLPDTEPARFYLLFGRGWSHLIGTWPPPGGFTVPGASLLPFESPNVVHTPFCASCAVTSSWYVLPRTRS
jgi:hypothetical protein